ncbi:MAG: histidine kinase [Salinivirgaceae bacterium]|nr:histidine kinase [Salinivirgaceae bacterium]
MNRQLLNYLLIVVALFVVGQLFAQEPNKTNIQSDLYTRFFNLTELDGLSNNKILDIIQDAEGFIWIATTDGLNRFDGYRFKIYRNDLNDSLSISDNFITSLEIDVNHNLWIGTKNGLNKYNALVDGFNLYPVQSKESKGISDGYIRKIFSNRKDDTLWVETGDETLNMIDNKNSVVTFIKHKSVGSSYYNYHSIFEDSKGLIWFGGRDLGPYKYNKETQQLAFIQAAYNNPKKKRDNDIACIFEDSKGHYWMSAIDGFYQYFPDKDEFAKLLATSTFDIRESSDSNLWLATSAGLYFYNVMDKQFINYQFNPSDNLSIISNRLNCLFIDDKENLWIGTDNGISIIERKKNVFKFYRSLPEVKNSIPSSQVSVFLEDSDSNLWIGTMGSGLVKWNKATNTFKSYEKEFGNQKVSCLFEDSQKDIWIGLWSGTGFYKFNKKEESFKRNAIHFNSYKADWYNDFYEDSKGRLWVGVWGYQGVSVYDRDSSKFEKYSFRLNESPSNWPVYKVLSKANKVWVTSKFNSIYDFNKTTKIFSSIQNIENQKILPEWRYINKKSITNLFDKNGVNDIIRDTGNVAYFATQNGLIQLKDQKFRLFKNVLTPISTLSDITVTSVFYFASGNKIYEYDCKFDDSNLIATLDAGIKIKALHSFKRSLWIGSNKGLFSLDIPTGKVKRSNSIQVSISDIKSAYKNSLLFASDEGLFILNTELQELKHMNISSAFDKGMLSEYITDICYYDNKQIAYLATDKGLLEYSFKKDVFKSVELFEGIFIHDISAQGTDTLWLATENGLASYSIKKNKAKFFSSFTKHQTTSRLTKFIFEDSKKNVWIGSTDNGLSRINTENYEIDHFLSNTEDEKNLWGANSTCIYELKDGRILIGAKGLNIYSYETNSFSHLVKNAEFPTNDILGITQDDNAKIWISSSKGLIKLNADLRVENIYYTEWGLELHNFTEAFTKISTGELLIGSKNGFYSCNPTDLDEIETKSKLKFTGLFIFGKEKNVDFKESKKVLLNYDENFFTIEFTDFTYQNSNPEFLYKLEGVDNDWVNSGKLNQATYTKIATGNYVFKLKKKNQPLIEEQRLKIAIVPPFWKQNWFIVLEIFIALVALYLLYLQQINKYKIRTKHLQLEHTLLRSQMNPHFILNALQAIKNTMVTNTSEVENYLSKFKDLMRLFLIDNRQAFIPLSQELETLSNYLELQRLGFNHSFYYTINCVEGIDTESILIPPMMAQPFIENALEHGFKGIDYQGEIDVKFYFHDTHIRITIIDNGVGINRARANKLSDDEAHESLVTVITRDRLKSYSSRKIKYDLEIIDRMELLTKENGTRVTLRVPFKKGV